MWLKRVSYFERLDICVFFIIIIIDITFIFIQSYHNNSLTVKAIAERNGTAF